MQVFEFQFNPLKKEKIKTSDVIFDSFCYEPENVYEKRVGSLYIIGFLKYLLPQNIRFLDNLAKLIKERYYKSIGAIPEKSLKESLRKANEYLEKIAKRGDVSWLGNLSFGVFSLKDFELNFTKVGDIKIFLIRKGQIIDIDQKIKFDEIEPYPLKIFGNIVSGKLAEDDIILVSTNDVATVLSEENLLDNVAKITLNVSSEEIPKMIKTVFNSKKEKLLKLSGTCLLILLTKEILVKEKETISQPKELFHFPKLKIPTFKIPTFKIPTLKIPKPKISTPQIKFTLPKPKISIFKIKFTLPKLKLPELKIKGFLLGKNAIMILSLIFFLALGYLIFQKSAEEELKVYQNQLEQIEEKVEQAENYLIISEGNPQAKKNANSLLKEGWEGISPLYELSSSFPSDFSNQILTLRDDILENLYQLNKLIEIPKPELIFEFKTKEFIPQKIVSFEGNLYFFSPYSENILKVDQENKEKIISIDKKLSLATLLTDSILFYSKPNQLINFKNDNFDEPIYLETSYSDFTFNSFSSYRSNLYFLDTKNEKVIKYPYLENYQWASPEIWLENKKAKDFKSMAVDGSIWLLTKYNSIEWYYTGKIQEELELELFPYPKNFSKIYTSPLLSYLYILEPIENRIIILDKTGKVIKQFHSEKFDNLLDFFVSKDGKTIYLLNGLKVYQLKL